MKTRRDLGGMAAAAAALGAAICLSVGASAGEAPAQQAGTGLAGRKLEQVALVTDDLDRALRFYRDVLGLPLMFEAGRMLFFDIGEGQRLMVGENRGSGHRPGGATIYFNTPDFDTTMNELEARGVVYVAPVEIVQRTATHELKLREFDDPDGNHLALIGEVPFAR